MQADADGLRTDMARCLRAIAGDGSADGSGVEKLISNFCDRAEELKKGFIRDRWDREQEKVDNETPAGLRAEIDALRKELVEKEALMTKHKANVLRWHDECHSVFEAISVVPMPPQKPMPT